MTLAEFNKKLQKEYPGLILQKGHGYFYLRYDENDASYDLRKKLNRLQSTSIMANSFNQMSQTMWMSDIKDMLGESMNRSEQLITQCEGVHTRTLPDRMTPRLNPSLIGNLRDKKYSYFDEVTAKHSAFKTFLELLDAKGNYRPSIKLAGRMPYDRGELEFLAQLYDKAQELRGDERRAYITY